MRKLLLLNLGKLLLRNANIFVFPPSVIKCFVVVVVNSRSIIEKTKNLLYFTTIYAVRATAASQWVSQVKIIFIYEQTMKTILFRV